MPQKTQLQDGRWVPAQPLPFYRDTRSVPAKFLSVVKIICYVMFKVTFICFFSKDKKASMDRLEDRIDRMSDDYLIPIEPYTDKDGNWHSY